MSLVNEQAAFLQDVAKLIQQVPKVGLQATAGELWRPQEMQDLYLAQGKTKAKTSNHTRRLAIDLNVFKGGSMATLDQIRPLGQFWESLNPLNRWGGNFSTIKDGPHFERNSAP